MQKLFSKILVPVDFSPQSDIAVEKAVQMAGVYHCSIHLLHTLTAESFAAMTASGPYIITGGEGLDNYNETEFRLKKTCECIITDTGGGGQSQLQCFVGKLDTGCN